ncbi:MAG: PEP-CTERM sorting domain-containing protein [Spirulinaceae cyanobacterium RM2_2_10]|nr:PEP-CTERM sorting domain-containing protein [Spirulinaceae cyanobacterium SM2_1_0]NJO21105.1 PEP-CTERM sorting domain-containing protein [Spirulinaceae cyanobacterium RM2_2_10]
MKFSTKAILSGLFASSALAVASAPAQAFNFTTGENVGACAGISYTDGLDTCTTADGFTLTVTQDGEDGSLGGFLSTKTVNGVTALGVFGDPSPNEGTLEEIDFGEEITATLETAQIIKYIDLAFLFQPGEFGDVVFEVAQLTVNGLIGTLAITGDNTAAWSFDGSDPVELIALSESTEEGSGLYRILNPFGDLAVDAIAFSSVELAGDSFRFSDYSLAGIQAADVPEPGLMLGLGVVGSALYAARRRRA